MLLYVSRAKNGPLGTLPNTKTVEVAVFGDGHAKFALVAREVRSNPPLRAFGIDASRFAYDRMTLQVSLGRRLHWEVPNHLWGSAASRT